MYYENENYSVVKDDNEDGYLVFNKKSLIAEVETKILPEAIKIAQVLNLTLQKIYSEPEPTTDDLPEPTYSEFLN